MEAAASGNQDTALETSAEAGETGGRGVTMNATVSRAPVPERATTSARNSPRWLGVTASTCGRNASGMVCIPSVDLVVGREAARLHRLRGGRVRRGVAIAKASAFRWDPRTSPSTTGRGRCGQKPDRPGGSAGTSRRRKLLTIQCAGSGRKVRRPRSRKAVRIAAGNGSRSAKAPPRNPTG